MPLGFARTRDVPGALGVSKVQLIFKNKPPRKNKLLPLFIYSLFFLVIFLSFSWTRPNMRETQTIPFFRLFFSGFDYFKSTQSNYLSKSEYQPSNLIVPIVSNNLQDAIFEQGKLHSIDRFSQMEIYRRLVLGNLSILTGNATLSQDKLAKTIDFISLAKQDYSFLDTEERSYLQSYCDGVNYYIENETSFGFTLDLGLMGLGVFNVSSISPWEPFHTLAIARFLAYQWSHGWEDELKAFLSENLVGLEAASLINPFNNTEGEESLSNGYATFLPSLGGNIVAVGKDSSSSNKSFLVYDLHSSNLYQASWYSTEINIKDTKISGLSFPGIPYVLIGKNNHVSWAFTQSKKYDTEDLFISYSHEEIPANRDMSTRIEYLNSYGYNFNQSVTMKIDQLDNCPNVIPILHPTILSSVLKAKINKVFLCGQSMRQRINLSSWRKMNLATDIDSFIAEAAKINYLSLNFVFTSKAGHIGSFSSGKNPIRSTSYDSSRPVLVSSGNRWLDSDSSSDSSFTFTKTQGIIVAGSRYFAQRVLELNSPLESNKVSALFKDVISPSSLQLKDEILDYLNSNSDFASQSWKEIIKLLESFNGQYSLNDHAPVFIESFRITFFDKLLRPLGPLSQVFLGGKIQPILRESANDLRLHRTVNDFTTLESNWWFIVSGGYDWIMTESLEHVKDWASKNIGKNPKSWKWGKAHSLRINHVIVPGSNSIVNEVSTIGPIAYPGGLDTLFRTSYRGSVGLIDRESLYCLDSLMSSARSTVDEYGNQTIQLAFPRSNRMGSWYFYSEESFRSFSKV